MTQTAEPPDAGRIVITDAASLRVGRRQLLEDARYQLAILAPWLAAGSYDDEAELGALRRIATSGRHARVRVLLLEPERALREGHRLVLLAQRLSSAIEIRTPMQPEDRADLSGGLLNDVGGYLRQPDPSRAEALGQRRDRAGQAVLLRHFDELWERSQRARALDWLGI